MTAGRLCQKERVAKSEKQKRPLDDVEAAGLCVCPKVSFAFEKATRKAGAIAVICECKKASPSKGLIAPDFPYLEIAKEYELAGADCISVLTEPSRFLGNDAYLKEIAHAVSIPCLRKDFTVDEYMIYEAKLLGAKAILLICSILNQQQVKDYIEICNTLGMSALVEAHDEKEVMAAVDAGARMIGVNNRNLKDFSVDTENSRRMRGLVPRDILFVAESGVKSARDVALLREIGADAVLIGEALMRAENKAENAAGAKRYAMTKIKLCGMVNLCDIDYANELMPDYVGFVFAPKSKRCVTPERAEIVSAIN